MKPTVRIGLCILVLLCLSQRGWAGTGADAATIIPSVVERGLSAFRVNGGEEAIRNWTRDGPLEGSRGEATEIAAIEKLEGLYGRFQGSSVIAEVELSPGSTLLYLEVRLEDGPIYVRLHVFDGRKGERVVGMTIGAAPEQILPPFVLERRTSGVPAP